MKTRLLGLAVVLVALAVIVNALALNSATVNGSQISASIVNTSQALVAVVGGTDADVQFTDGTTASISVDDGIQANSAYSFNSAFGIKNNSANNIKVTLTVTPAGSGPTMTLSPAVGSGLTDLPITAGQTLYFNMDLSAGVGASAGSGTYTISVAASKTP